MAAKKKESTFINMVVVLLIVSAVAATALAFVYQATKAPIAKAKLEKDKKAVGLVVPKFDNDPVSESDTLKIDKRSELIFYPAKRGGELVGVAVKTYSDIGFTERIKIMVGFTADGKIYGTSVLEHKETPGLGDKMQKNKTMDIVKNEDGSKDTTWWSKQFIGKIPEFKITKQDGEDVPDPVNIKVSKDGGEVDAITAATITSRAFCDAVNRAYIEFEKRNNK